MDVPIKLKCGHNILVQPMFANLKTFMCRICDDIRFGCCDVCGVIAAVTLGEPEPFHPVGKQICFGCALEGKPDELESYLSGGMNSEKGQN